MPSFVYVGQAATLYTYGSFDPDGVITNYRWDLDGNGTFERDAGPSSVVSHTFTTVGPVSIGLQVTDNRGASAVVRGTLTVSPLPNRVPTASFTVSPNPATVGQVVTFDGRASSDPDGQPLTYDWDFGDGSPHASGATATHTYIAPASVVTRLRVTDSQNPPTRRLGR